MALDLSSAPTAPPRSSKKQTAAVKAATGLKAKREESVNGVLQVGTLGLTMAGLYADAGTLGKYGPSLAAELANLAETNESFAKGIDYLDNVGPYGALATILIPFGLQIAANHKLVRAEAFAGAGVVHPDTITAQVKTDMARMRTEALQAQQEAERQTADLQAQARKIQAENEPQATMGTQAAA